MRNLLAVLGSVLLVACVDGTAPSVCAVEVVGHSVLTRYGAKWAGGSCTDTLLFWRDRCQHGDSVFIKPLKHC